ncbi:RNA ligase family protein [Actinomadura parmotrematis]|uniref:RNA ligase family protein n=1 Tax=Actinomadura parmotrematis TaxID=2864039 RepID=A0ABS7FQZ2_9ACTN|nr:RNA ligase family protein [Actinomadura parmotrematis]MBW8482726.1 RNA ligase family protein [Actinomadura parmotrematis]
MLRKYPRTRHLQGSRLQTGDHDLAAVPFAEIAGRFLVVEEKLDGANCGVSFDAGGQLLLQSRGHYLTGGPREKQFAPLKAWAASVQHLLWPRLGERYVMYGEWLYAKHTVFYDALPHYFCEFDVLDRAEGAFLSTARRRELLAGAPVVPVPVLHEGPLANVRELTSLVGPSTCRTPAWREALRAAAVAGGADPDRVAAETDAHEEMEGLYIKVEEGGRTVDRFKWVRASFLNTIADAGTHWQDRPLVANGLADPEVLYAGG